VTNAAKKMKASLAYLKEMFLLEYEGREVPLNEALLYLQTLTREGAFVSRALIELSNEGKITIDDHVVRMSTA
jgi:hypothetical protein